MKDEFAASRLPDLPNDGYSTSRERQMTDEIMFFIRGCERNRILLLSIVCDGKDKWRSIARKAWKHLKVTTELADKVFGYLELLAGEFPYLQLQELKRQQQMSAADRVWELHGRD